MKKVVISCGPIPAKLDSVKYITNRFKGGLAFKTADLLREDYELTIIMWKYTEIPVAYQTHFMEPLVKIVKVEDVTEYCEWFVNHAFEYDAFIMAAAVANLMPKDPYEGKFPSHLYNVGDEFDIKFTIAPRAIDIVKKINPRASLIGYKLFDGTEDELIMAAKLTQSESKANIIFANNPKTAKSEKIAITPDGACIKCSFDEHISMIKRQINATYFRTKIEPLTEEELNDVNIRNALATVKMFEHTFEKYGTVAIPVKGHKGEMFATTSRGHKGEPVIVRDVDFETYTVIATDKATLNAPTLAVCLENDDTYVVHRHFDDKYYNPSMTWHIPYQFPGTKEEAEVIKDKIKKHPVRRFVIECHGDLTIRKFETPDWNAYHSQFPKKYFSTPEEMEKFIRENKDDNCLEVGANETSDAAYAYDPYVLSENAINLMLEEVMSRHFSMIYIRNAINYIDLDVLTDFISHCDMFIANTFRKAPDEKVCDNEVSVSNGKYVFHTLRLSDDTLLRHEFHAYTEKDFESLGLTITHYNNNSMIVFKNNTVELDFEPD